MFSTKHVHVSDAATRFSDKSGSSNLTRVSRETVIREPVGRRIVYSMFSVACRVVRFEFVKCSLFLFADRTPKKSFPVNDGDARKASQNGVIDHFRITSRLSGQRAKTYPTATEQWGRRAVTMLLWSPFEWNRCADATVSISVGKNSFGALSVLVNFCFFVIFGLTHNYFFFKWTWSKTFLTIQMLLQFLFG